MPVTMISRKVDNADSYRLLHLKTVYGNTSGALAILPILVCLLFKKDYFDVSPYKTDNS